MKKLKNTEGALQDLEKALSSPGQPTRCVTIPKNLDGRIQVVTVHKQNIPNIYFLSIVLEITLNASFIWIIGSPSQRLTPCLILSRVEVAGSWIASGTQARTVLQVRLQERWRQAEGSLHQSVPLRQGRHFCFATRTGPDLSSRFYSGWIDFVRADVTAGNVLSSFSSYSYLLNRLFKMLSSNLFSKNNLYLKTDLNLTLQIIFPVLIWLELTQLIFFSFFLNN